MKKLTLLLVILLCAVFLLTACAAEQPGTTNDTVPSTAIDPTAAPTVPTAVPADPPTDPPTDPPADPPTDPPTEPTDPTIPLPTSAGNSLEYHPGSIQLVDRESDDYPFDRKYRNLYYTIYGEFLRLLDDEQSEDCSRWLQASSKETNYGEFREEMLLVTMVKRYNIPREEFDRAVARYVANTIELGGGMMHEEYEVPNADVIYTFDNELINRYYRYE